MHKASKTRSSQLMNEMMRLFFKWDTQPSGRASFYLKYLVLGYCSKEVQQGFVVHSSLSWSNATLRYMCGHIDAGSISQALLTMSANKDHLTDALFRGQACQDTEFQRPDPATNKWNVWKTSPMHHCIVPLVTCVMPGMNLFPTTCSASGPEIVKYSATTVKLEWET